MGPDDQVQRIVQTGTGTAGFYGFASALWLRGGRFFAEARVFVRGSSPEVQGVVDTIRVEASERMLAIALLEGKLAERFGRVEWVRWTPPES